MKISGRYTLVQTEKPAARFTIQQPFTRICESQQPTIRIESAACPTVKDLRLFVECTPTIWDDGETIWDPELLQAEEGYYNFTGATEVTPSASLVAGAVNTTLGGGVFCSDGMFYIVVSEDTRWVRKYSLASAYNLRGAVIAQEVQIASLNIDLVGLDVSSDGLNLYVLRYSASVYTAYRYTMSSALDITTLSVSAAESLSLIHSPNPLFLPVSISWNLTGSRFLVAYYHSTGVFGMVKEYVSASPFVLTGSTVDAIYYDTLNKRFNQAKYFANDTCIMLSHIHKCDGTTDSSYLSAKKLTLASAGNLSGGVSLEECFTVSLSTTFNPSVRVITTGLESFWVRVATNTYKEYSTPYVITQPEVWSTEPGTTWDDSCRNLPFNVPPDAPVVTAGSITATSVTLSGSAFFDMNAEDTHRASQWQVDIAAGDYSSPVDDSGEDQTNLLSYAVTGLTTATQYKARARYQDEGRKWSAWSDSATFTTA